MLVFPIAEAKAHFAQLVRVAEAGQPVRITRRGKVVAVLLSATAHEQLLAPKGDWLTFSMAWRERMAQSGTAFFTDEELAIRRGDLLAR